MIPLPAHADAGLQLNPLKYEDKITGDTVHRGYIDIANPADTSVTVQTSVRGFRQVDLDGNLAFYDDATLSAGIIPDLPSFELSARDAIRMYFSVVPTKLSHGAIYAAIFFRTIPTNGPSDTSYLTASANLGTLLILQNGRANAPSGKISSWNLPYFQFGSGIGGIATLLNTSSQEASPLTAELESKVGWIGTPAKVASGLVTPGTSRNFHIFRTGSYIGILPVQLRDTNTGASATGWTLVCTGWYRFVLPILIVTILFFVGQRYLHRRRRKKKTRKQAIVRDIKPLSKP